VVVIIIVIVILIRIKYATLTIMIVIVIANKHHIKLIVNLPKHLCLLWKSYLQLEKFEQKKQFLEGSNQPLSDSLLSDSGEIVIGLGWEEASRQYIKKLFPWCWYLRFTWVGSLNPFILVTAIPQLINEVLFSI
jgi:hypothetical protein